MQVTWKQRWPEALLALTAAFFFIRELGTFPESWIDDGLFMIVARNLAEGRGYAMPVLDRMWYYSYFLAVGPTVILPSVLLIKLFGFSVAIARIPMVAYLAAATVALYAYANLIGGRRNACFAAALLISFSAFVNTGKPVMGEVPALLFIFLGLLSFERAMRSWKWAIICGFFFGIAFVTKTTMGLLFPALGCAFLVTLVRRRGWKNVLVITIAALATVIPFMTVLGMTDPGWLPEIIQYGAAGGGSEFLQVLRTKPELLTRFQYLYALGTLLPLGIIGWWSARKQMHPAHAAFVLILILLIVLYFLNERGFYRHYLPAHILLIPFVPKGIFSLVKKRIAAAVLTFFIAAQGWWQLDHRGSRRLNEAIPAAEALEREYRDMRMVIEQPEVFVLLSQNPNWMFLSEEFQLRAYQRFPDLPVTREEHCLPLLRKMEAAEKATYAEGRIKTVAARYVLIMPAPDCGTPYGAAE